MTAVEKLKYWIERCADCDVCRTNMEEGCLMFPELFRLWDIQQESGVKITTEQMRHLTNLCNLCGICPCPEVPTTLMEAKAEFMSKSGLPLSIKAIERVELLGKIANTAPGVTNFFLGNQAIRSVLWSALGIHKDRKLPFFPKESFPNWLKNGNRSAGVRKNPKRKVAYFVGCTARYYVPDIGKAAVEVLQRNGIEVYIPDQKCCGMPPLLEGDRDLALELAGFNLERLAETVEDGYDIVCSCPTCGFALKRLYKEGAVHSPEYKARSGKGDAEWKKLLSVPLEERTDLWMAEYGYEYIMRTLEDDGYFASLNPLKRVAVAENTYDLGEYLRNLHKNGELDVRFGAVQARSTYYPPCHLREQRIGTPYTELLSLVPGLEIDSVSGLFYCCGIAGIAGFKRDFHGNSVNMATKLVDRINKQNPEKLLTDCLGCRTQFNHLMPYAVFHPIEVMKEAYDNYCETRN